MASIEAIAVIIPARDEEVLLPNCLAAVERAAAPLEVPVHIVVALDHCRDDSGDVVRRHTAVTPIEIDAGNVGLARAAATEAALRLGSDIAPDRLWIATTDADSQVPHDWLTGQLALAADGWEVVVGTVEVPDWSEHHSDVSRRWAASYTAVEHHQHVHGANLGLTAAAYLAAGGWPPLAAHEDVALVAALAGRRITRTAAHPVRTSARRDPRASGGFGDTLRALAG